MGELRIGYLPVTLERLDDLAQFSSSHGRFRYCSCMRWRLRSSEYQEASTEGRSESLIRRVGAGEPVGVLAYLEGEPVGWCSIAPRESYAALERYGKLARVDDRPVWSVACFFIDRKLRKKGLTLGLLRAAVQYARSMGAEVVEGYPVPRGVLYGFMGTPETFRRAGFRNVTPPGRERQVFRHFIGRQAP